MATWRDVGTFMWSESEVLDALADEIQERALTGAEAAELIRSAAKDCRIASDLACEGVLAS